MATETNHIKICAKALQTDNINPNPNIFLSSFLSLLPLSLHLFLLLCFLLPTLLILAFTYLSYTNLNNMIPSIECSQLNRDNRYINNMYEKNNNFIEETVVINWVWRRARRGCESSQYELDIVRCHQVEISGKRNSFYSLLREES